MPRLLWNASALVKRYAAELGSPTVDTLFNAATDAPMVITVLGYAEACAALRRKLNQGMLDLALFQHGRALLSSEILNSVGVLVLSVDDGATLRGISLCDRHNLNASDAAILATYIEYAQTIPGIRCAVVSSDQRFLRAALAEGLRALNPELIAPADVPAALHACDS